MEAKVTQIDVNRSSQNIISDNICCVLMFIGPIYQKSKTITKNEKKNGPVAMVAGLPSNNLYFGQFTPPKKSGQPLLENVSNFEK